MADDNRWSDRDRDWRDDRAYTEPGMDRGGRWSRGRGGGRDEYGDGGRASPGYNPAGPAQNSGFDRGYGYYDDQDYRSRPGGEQNYRAARAYQEGDDGFPAYGGRGRGGYEGSGGYAEGQETGYSRYPRGYGQAYGRRTPDYGYGPYTPYGAVTEGETSADYDRSEPWRGDGYRRGGGFRREAAYRGDEGRPGEHRSWLERTGEKLGHFVRDLGREGGDRFHDPLTADDYHGEHGGRGPKGYRRSDERIREDVSDRFTEDRYLDATNIGVTVTDSEVTLDGTVSSRQAKRHAEDIAERVSGVTHVQNNLRVKDDRTSTDEAIIDGTGVVPEA